MLSCFDVEKLNTMLCIASLNFPNNKKKKIPFSNNVQRPEMEVTER